MSAQEAEWQAKVAAKCDRCRSPLRLLEGPMCDACLDLSELDDAPLDRYSHIREKDNRIANGLPPDPHVFSNASKKNTAKDRFAFNFETGEFIWPKAIERPVTLPDIRPQCVYVTKRRARKRTGAQ